MVFLRLLNGSGDEAPRSMSKLIGEITAGDRSGCDGDVVWVCGLEGGASNVAAFSAG